MATCFLFADYLTNEQCLSLVLDSKGQEIASLMSRDFAEIKLLQKNTQTIIVLSSHHIGFHHVELPWLNAKKAKAAIPFALEDKVAQNINSLHFAFDRNYYSDGRYLVIISDKNYLLELIASLDEKDIDFDCIALDWFSLNKNEIFVTSNKNYLLVNTKSFQGALTEELAFFYLKNLYSEQSTELENEIMLYFFNDPLYLKEAEKVGSIEEDSHLFTNNKFSVTTIDVHPAIFIARRLQKIKPMNLCQGDLQHGNLQTKIKSWYKAAAIMTFLWIISFAIVNTLKIYSLNKENAELDAKIAAIYKEFFPGAQQVISPEFRIKQLLMNKENKHTSLWLLLNKIAKLYDKSPIAIENINFENNMILMTLATADFAELEKIETKLEQAGIKVKQTQASTQKNKVLGTLELSL